MKEQEIIALCVANDRKGQKAFVDQYSNYLYAICVRYVSDREIAKDVLQESLVQVLKNMHKYEDQGKFKAWISKITVFKCLEHLRREKKYTSDDLSSVNYASSYSNAQHYLEEADVLKFIDDLPPKYRIAINMYIVEGYSHKEIGEHLGVTESSSRSLVNRGRNLLKERFPSELKVIYKKKTALHKKGGQTISI